MHTCLPSSLAFFFLFLTPYVKCIDIDYRRLVAVCENGNGNYTNPSPYKTNLNQLFSSLSTQTIKAGFSKNTMGASPNQVWGLILCRGDVDNTICLTCINLLLANISSSCPNQKDATLWYDYCYIRYSQKDFLSTYNNSYKLLYWNDYEISSNETTRTNFKPQVASLLYGTSNYTVNKSRNLFGTGLMTLPNWKIQGLAQCTPDMPKDACFDCLASLINLTLSEYDGKVGGRVLGDRCNIRFETYLFFFGDPNFSYPPPSNRGTIIAIIAGSITLVLILTCFFIFFKLRRKHRRKRRTDNEDVQELAMLGEIRNGGLGFSQFSFSQIENATNHFNLKLGEGGFGPVYKGVLPEGLEIAVKRLAARSGQGLIEFKNEIQLIGEVQHVNLIRLVGWCAKGEEKLLIYEFLPNKSLDCFIFDEIKRKLLNWPKRFEIIDGIAQGLLYLHQHSRPRIIHRDLKTSNILLDADMTPKISDFGLARTFGVDQVEADATQLVGTRGYMAPEYATEGRFSVKSDVYSFGVMLLEIISGKKNMGLALGSVWEDWGEGNWLKLVDLSLTEISESQIKRCIHIALLCIQHNPNDRPTMANIIASLSNESMILPTLNKPTFFSIAILDEEVTSSNFDSSIPSFKERSIIKAVGR